MTMVSDINSTSPELRSRSKSPIKTDIQSNSHTDLDKVEENSSKSKSRSSSRAESRTSSDSRSRSRSKSISRSKSRRNNRDESNHRSSKRHRRRSRSHSKKSSKSRSRSRSRGRHNGRHDREKRKRRYSRSESRSRSPSPYHRRMNPSPCRVLGVFGLNFQTGERELKRTFEKYGRLDKVKLVTDPRTGRSRGFAFIYFQNVDDAEEAKDKVHGHELDGNHVRVEYSISNREHNPTPGVYMGRRTTSSRYHRDDDYHSSRNGTRYSSKSRSRSYERRRRSYSRD